MAVAVECDRLPAPGGLSGASRAALLVSRLLQALAGLTTRPRFNLRLIVGDSPLVEDWLERVGEARAIDVSEQPHVFPELLEAYTPPGFVVIPRRGAKVEVDASGGITVDFAASLYPEELSPSDRETPTGTIHRTFNTARGNALHRRLTIPAGWQGRGAGRAVTWSAVQLYDQLGIETVSLVAVDDGRYVWAMCGFDFFLPDDREHVIQAVSEFAEELGFEAAFGDLQHPWEIGALEAEGQELTLREVAEALKDPLQYSAEAADKLDQPIRLGKALLLFGRYSGWYGVLDLRSESLGRRELFRYTQGAEPDGNDG